ncbi:MAG: hypothetical protein JWN76_1243 [Chitinophagaceae bacterium]|nr:hypothetical protein [Chitinophagaceae bacterium]
MKMSISTLSASLFGWTGTLAQVDTHPVNALEIILKYLPGILGTIIPLLHINERRKMKKQAKKDLQNNLDTTIKKQL